MKKIAITVLLAVTALSSLGFSSYDFDRSYGRKEIYDKVYSNYSNKIDLLHTRLSQKNTDIRNEKRKKKPDWMKIERLENERSIISRELDNTYQDIRNDLRYYRY